MRSAVCPDDCLICVVASQDASRAYMLLACINRCAHAYQLNLLVLLNNLAVNMAQVAPMGGSETMRGTTQFGVSQSSTPQPPPPPPPKAPKPKTTQPRPPQPPQPPQPEVPQTDTTQTKTTQPQPPHPEVPQPETQTDTTQPQPPQPEVPQTETSPTQPPESPAPRLSRSSSPQPMFLPPSSQPSRPAHVGPAATDEMAGANKEVDRIIKHEHSDNRLDETLQAPITTKDVTEGDANMSTA